MNEQIPKATFQNVKENLSRREKAVTEAGVDWGQVSKYFCPYSGI